jgi:hypothetical protein
VNLVSRAIAVLFGLAVALGAAVVFLPFAALFDPATREAAGLVLSAFGALAMHNAGLSPAAGSEAMTGLAALIWSVALVICVLPLVVTALIGEALRLRSVIWYAGVTGFCAAAAPWLVRAVRHMERTTSASPHEMRLALLFFLTGVVSGFVYWLISGRRAGLADF